MPYPENIDGFNHTLDQPVGDGDPSLSDVIPSPETLLAEVHQPERLGFGERLRRGLERIDRGLGNLEQSLRRALTPSEPDMSELAIAGSVHSIELPENHELNEFRETHTDLYRVMPPPIGKYRPRHGGHGNSETQAPIVLYPKPPKHKKFHKIRHFWWGLLGDPGKVAANVVMNAYDRDNGLRIKQYVTGKAKDVVMEDKALLKDRFISILTSKAILSGGKIALKAVRHTTEETVGNTILRSIPFVQLASTLAHTRFIDGVKENNRLAGLLTVTDFLSLPLPAITTFALPIPFVGTSVGIALSPSFYLDLWASISSNAHLRETTDNIGEYIKQVLANRDTRLYYPRLALAQRIMESAQVHPEYFNGLHKAMDDLNPNMYIPNNKAHQDLVETANMYSQKIQMLEDWLAERKRKNIFKRLWTVDVRLRVDQYLEDLRKQKNKLIDQPYQEAKDMYITWKLTRQIIAAHEGHLAKQQR